MEIYSQLDLRWADKRIGGSKIFVGRYGCALTSLVNLANALGTNWRGHTPGTLAAQAQCFTPDGLIIWTEACKLLNLRFVGTESRENMPKILAAIKNPKTGVILNVNNGAHFVLGWSSTLFGGDVKSADPLGGVVVKTKAKYHNITGARYFEKA